MIKEVKNAFNTVKEVFTQEYKDETKYLEFQEKMVSKIKLKGTSESIDDKMNRLAGYTSNCSVAIGSYEEECVKTENKVKVKK